MSEEQAAPTDEKQNPAAPPAAPSSASPPTSVILLGFAAVALLGVLIAISMGGSRDPSGGDDEGVRELKARIQLQQQNLNAERARLGLSPLYGDETIESAEAVAARITDDAATLVALSKGVQKIIIDKDAEIAARTKETTEAVKLQNILRDELAQVKKELNRALIDGSDASTLRSQLEAANQRLVSLGEEVRRLNEEAAGGRIAINEKAALEARIRELEAQLSQASLFAGTEAELFKEAVELFRSLRELENKPDSEIARAYSQYGANLGATVLDKLDFETGSSEVHAGDLEKIRSFVEQAPGNALLFVIGYASETGDVDHNRALSSDRATAVARVLDAAKKPGQRVQAAYMGQTDRFGSRFPERNQICEVWQIVPKD